MTAAVAVGGGTYLHLPKFGAKAEGARRERILASPHYMDGEFKNIEPIINVKSDGNFLSSMKQLLFPTKGINVPDKDVPTKKTDLKALSKDEDVLIWMGHSSHYLQLGGKKILVDPVFSSYASPVPFLIRAFPGTSIYTVEDMPQQIDVLLISHDHWDHLDYATVMGLKDKIKNVVCPLGVGAHFESWGFAPEIIHEADWYEEIALEDMFKIYVLPSRHFSGRLFDRNQTLWGSFAFITPQKKVFYSGDGGYGKHFKEIGKMFGSFDLAIMEDGQYNTSWPMVHMMPEESAQAAIDIGAKLVVPVHAGKFCLSPHYWQEPYERIEKASIDFVNSYRLLTPEIGEAVYFAKNEQNFIEWWKV